MYKGYKFRIYPNKEQLALINKTLGSTRFVYNYYLNKIKESKETEHTDTDAYSCIKDYITNLRYEHSFLQDISLSIIESTIFILINNFKRYQNGMSNYPKFKSKNYTQKYTIPAVYKTSNNKIYSNIKLDLKTKRINLSNIESIKIKGYNDIYNINGKIVSATISKEQTDKYYVSVIYEIYDKVPTVDAKSIVGIDLGVKKLLTLSNGITYDNNKYIAKYEKRIKRKQKELSRKVEGSENYKKCQKELVKLYSKLSNARKYYTHKITKEITDDYDIIACESLSTQKMIENSKSNGLSKRISDVTFNEILKQLSYKSKNKGKIFYQVSPKFPSSQICSKCNNIDSTYKDISKREYICKKCGNSLDRDINASLNILNEGLKLYIKDNL
mgnify:FL=1